MKQYLVARELLEEVSPSRSITSRIAICRISINYIIQGFVEDNQWRLIHNILCDVGISEIVGRTRIRIKYDIPDKN